MAGDCQTRGIPSSKRPGKPPATRQRWGCENGCGLNRRWPGWKPIHGPNLEVAAPASRWRPLFATMRDREGAASHVLKPRRLATAPPCGTSPSSSQHQRLISVKSAVQNGLAMRRPSGNAGSLPPPAEGTTAPAQRRPTGFGFVIFVRFVVPKPVWNR